MKGFLRKASLFCFSGCILVASASEAAVLPDVQDPLVYSRGPSLAPPSWLYTIEANGVTLQHLDGKNYRLTMPISQIRSILSFTDRPYHEAKRLTASQYAQQVHGGKDSFDRDPPNMTLVWKGRSELAKAYTSVSYTKTATTLTLNLKRISSESKTSEPELLRGDIGLFIDTMAGLTDIGITLCLALPICAIPYCLVRDCTNNGVGYVVEDEQNGGTKEVQVIQ